jgi:putative membrane protein
MKTRSTRGVVETAALAIALTLVLVDWAGAEITTRLAANEPPPTGGAPEADAAPTPERIAKQALSAEDRTFLEKALRGGAAEVQEAQLAQQKATSKDLKSAAADLEQDHRKANGELKILADSNGLKIAAEPPPERKALYERLKELPGAQFDAEYVSAGIDAHRRTIELFERTEKQTQNPAIKSFAGSTLPTLRHHLEMMQALDGK